MAVLMNVVKKYFLKCFCLSRLFYYYFMFQRCDLNGDGKLDYNEFKTMIFKNKERKQQEAEKNELEGKTSPKKKKQEKGKGKKKKK